MSMLPVTIPEYQPVCSTAAVTATTAGITFTMVDAVPKTVFTVGWPALKVSVAVPAAPKYDPGIRYTLPSQLDAPSPADQPVNPAPVPYGVPPITLVIVNTVGSYPVRPTLGLILKFT